MKKAASEPAALCVKRVYSVSDSVVVVAKLYLPLFVSAQQNGNEKRDPCSDDGGRRVISRPSTQE
jgi:hypothetical protein